MEHIWICEKWWSDYGFRAYIGRPDKLINGGLKTNPRILLTNKAKSASLPICRLLAIHKWIPKAFQCIEYCVARHLLRLPFFRDHEEGIPLRHWRPNYYKNPASNKNVIYLERVKLHYGQSWARYINWFQWFRWFLALLLVRVVSHGTHPSNRPNLVPTPTQRPTVE